MSGSVVTLSFGALHFVDTRVEKGGRWSSKFAVTSNKACWEERHSPAVLHGSEVGVDRVGVVGYRENLRDRGSDLFVASKIAAGSCSRARSNLKPSCLNLLFGHKCRTRLSLDAPLGIPYKPKRSLEFRPDVRELAARAVRQRRRIVFAQIHTINVLLHML